MAPSNAAMAAMSTLSPRETELLIFAMQCLTSGEPKLDYPKFAAVAGLTSPKAGMDSWYRIRKKLGLLNVSPSKTAHKKEDDGTEAAPVTPKRARAGRKPAKKEEGEEEGEEVGLKLEDDGPGELQEPAKKKRAVGRRRGRADTTAADAPDSNVGPL